MPQVVIENPILNSPFKEPAKHFKFSDDGITNEEVESRRISTYFVPIAKPRKKAGGRQLALDTGWTQDRVEENRFINRIRERVSRWRKGNYAGITNTTRQLLEYWTNPDRERKLFFCQIEAMETTIYLAEVANVNCNL
jgi:type III restriction enzyme